MGDPMSSVSLTASIGRLSARISCLYQPFAKAAGVSSQAITWTAPAILEARSLGCLS
jgi:hypothetical protein